MSRRPGGTLRDPVDGAALGVFRIAFGVIMLGEIVRFFAHGWIRRHYLEPAFLFTYPGFGWIHPWPGDGLYAHFAATGLCAVMVALGLCYRVAIVGLFLGFAYAFLLDQASYLNQYYLALCVALILCFLPAERAFSLDARRQRVAPVVPRWSVLALRTQFELMLLHAGFVKLNEDWLHGQPLGLWLSERSDLPIVGPWLALPGLAVVAAHGVVILHLIGAPLLLLRRTRLAVFVLYVGFHLASATLLRIGMFSWLTLAGTLMFFDPDWPRALWRRLGGGGDSAPVTAESSGRDRPASATLTLLAAFLVLQLLLPLRSLLYPGKVAWTRQGEWFSWRMKLDDSRASARFVVTAPGNGRRWEVDPHDYLSPRQTEMMAARPDLVLQFAHFLGRTWAAREGVADAEVRAIVRCALNGRQPALLIDPTRDLVRVSRTSTHRDWILPLTVPLAPRLAPGRRRSLDHPAHPVVCYDLTVTR
jgi:vitamin K-dependent gamma-carboxylase